MIVSPMRADEHVLQRVCWTRLELKKWDDQQQKGDDDRNPIRVSCAACFTALGDMRMESIETGCISPRRRARLVTLVTWPVQHVTRTSCGLDIVLINFDNTCPCWM